MKSIIGLLFATALSVFTNFVSDIIFPKIKKYEKLILIIFVFLVVFLSVMPFFPEENDHVDLLKILTPAEGQKVDSYVNVTGFSPFLKMNHYLIASTTKPPQQYIDGSPFSPESNGYWKATIHLGSGSSGIGQNYLIQVLSSETVLPEGPIKSFPKDSHISPAINVLRTK